MNGFGSLFCVEIADRINILYLFHVFYMEKLTLSDLLALLLPGTFLVVATNLICSCLPPFYRLDIRSLLGTMGESEAFLAVFYLLLAVATGAIVHFLNFLFAERKRRLYNYISGNLYLPTYLIFDELRNINFCLPFLNEDCRKKLGSSYTGNDTNAIIRETYFDYVFYYLICHREMPEMRVQQGFYFMFRNLFLSGLIFSVICLVLAITLWGMKGWVDARSLFALSILFLFLAYVIFRPVGRWYRARMVRFLFWQYYILRNTKNEV